MIDENTKQQFVLMRAENKSYTQIMKALPIGKNKCVELNRELSSQIAQQKAENLTSLYNSYYMTKEARIKQLGASLKKIETAIEKADFSGIAPDKLLDLKLKYTQALKAEYTEPAYQVDFEQPTPEAIYSLMLDLLNRVRAGIIDDIQAQKEFTVLCGLQKSYEDIELNNKVEAVKAMLEQNTAAITSRDL
jgi:hypothetical protein